MALFMTIFIGISMLGLAADSHYESKIVFHLSNRVIRMNIANIYLVFSTVLLFLICALRDVSVGVDTKDYVNTFLNKNALEIIIGDTNKFEIGYKFYIKFLRAFTDDPQIFVFITSLILFGGTYIFIWKNCIGSYGLSIAMFMAFLYYTYFSAIRQSIALVIAINSFNYIYNRKWVKALLLIILAALFHYTALVLLAFVPLSFTKWTRKKVLMAFGASFIAILLFDQIVEFILRIFPIYGRYWNSGMLKADESSRGTFALLVAAICICAFANLFKKEETFSNNQERAFYITALTGSIFCLFINILGLGQGVFSRMTRYFIPFVIVLTVNMYRIYIKKYRIFFYLGITCVTGVFFYSKMKNNIYQIIPYKFFFGGI